MRNVFMQFVFVALALALSAGHVNAQWGYGDYPDPTGTGLCSTDVTFWVAAAKEARDKGCNPGGAEWSTDAKTQGSFCMSASDSDRAYRTNTMKRYLSYCGICSGMADLFMTLNIDNLIRRCGFSNPDGRWTANRAYQLNKCTTVYTLLATQPVTSSSPAPNAYNKLFLEMEQQVYDCKKTHPDPSCISCHSSQAPSALQKNPSKASAQPSSLSATTNRRATLPKGSATSGNDLAKPSTAKSAMDALSGDNQLRSPSSNQRVTIPDGNRPAAPKALATPTPFESKRNWADNDTIISNHPSGRLLLLPAGPALAAAAATCAAYAKETVAKAKGVGQFACGYDLKDPRWTAEPKGHER